MNQKKYRAKRTGKILQQERSLKHNILKLQIKTSHHVLNIIRQSTSPLPAPLCCSSEFLSKKRVFTSASLISHCKRQADKPEARATVKQWALCKIYLKSKFSISNMMQPKNNDSDSNSTRNGHISISNLVSVKMCKVPPETEFHIPSRSFVSKLHLH